MSRAYKDPLVLKCEVWKNYQHCHNGPTCKCKFAFDLGTYQVKVNNKGLQFAFDINTSNV